MFRELTSGVDPELFITNNCVRDQKVVSAVQVKLLDCCYPVLVHSSVRFWSSVERMNVVSTSPPEPRLLCLPKYWSKNERTNFDTNFGVSVWSIVESSFYADTPVPSSGV